MEFFLLSITNRFVMYAFSRYLFVCVVTGFSLTSQGQSVYPYNPDGNADSLIGVYDLQDILSVYGQPFQTSEMTVNGVGLSQMFDSLFLLIENQQNIINDLQSNSEGWDLNCVDFGISGYCSPQGGFCSDVSMNANDMGEYPLSYECDQTWDASDCVYPTWRTFEISGPNAGEITALFRDKISHSVQQIGHYPNSLGRLDSSPIAFDVVDGNKIRFSVWSHAEGLNGWSVGTSHNNVNDWLNVYYSFFAVIDGKPLRLPFLLHL